MPRSILAIDCSESQLDRDPKKLIATIVSAKRRAPENVYLLNPDRLLLDNEISQFLHDAILTGTSVHMVGSKDEIPVRADWLVSPVL